MLRPHLPHTNVPCHLSEPVGHRIVLPQIPYDATFVLKTMYTVDAYLNLQGHEQCYYYDGQLQQWGMVPDFIFTPFFAFVPPCAPASSASSVSR